jgi:hypothetical protein
MITLPRGKNKKRKFKIPKITVEKNMQQGVHTTRGLLYTMQLYSRKTAWCAQVWEGAEKSENGFYVLKKNVKGKVYIMVATLKVHAVKIMITQTKK